MRVGPNVRWAAAVLLAAVAAGCSGDDPATAPTGAAETPAADVRYLVEQIEEIHPDPWRSVSESDFKTAAADLEARIDGLHPDRQLVELMRLVAMLGDRNGHTGIYPLDPSREPPVHAYPLSLWSFSDGVYVTAATDGGVVGKRLVAIAGTPAEEVRDAVRELVGADNDSTRLLHATAQMVSAEVLHGLGIVPEVGPATFTFVDEEVTLKPITAAAYAAALGKFFPMFIGGLPEREDILSLSRLEEHFWLTRLDGGRALYFGYNHVLGNPSALAERLQRLAKDPRVERIIVDVRQNGGGNNTTYWGLISALDSPAVDREGRLICLIGRVTFSAAGNFITDLEREAEHVLFVGEPSGSAPNQYGDAVQVSLPATGWTVYVAPEYIEKSQPDDPRVTTEPDLEVPWSGKDFFAGRDPVLEAALSH